MKRSYASLLESYLKAFPCVALFGVRQCGKTTLLQTVINNDVVARRYEEDLIGLPFTWL